MTLGYGFVRSLSRPYALKPFHHQNQEAQVTSNLSGSHEIEALRFFDGKVIDLSTEAMGL